MATAFALAVTHPQAGNIGGGGGGFMVYMNDSSKVITIDFREMAPINASSDMFLDENGQLVRGSNHNGALSVGVPGTMAGLYLAHQKYGSLPWKELVQPSIDLAQNGVVLSYAFASHAEGIENSNAPDFLKTLYLDHAGVPLTFGDIWKQAALANTLKLIRDKGRDGFYKGEVAEEIARYMKANGGIISKQDLLEYEAIEREPMSGTYDDYQIYSMAPPSSEGVAMIEMLNILEQVDMDDVQFNSTEYVHLVAEVMRRAFTDRAEHLGDPDFNLEMPLDKLTSKEFATTRLQNIDMAHASESDSSRFGQIYDGTNTTHFSVIDKDGNSVSVTYTLEQSYGSGMGSEKLGFIFNNEMGDFNPQPGYTNSGWLIGTDANVIAPKKRMLSSMMPTIIAKDGKPVLIIGSPGGRTIINTVFQTVLCFLEYDMSISESIEAMKIHHQWLPNTLVYEENKLSPDTIEALKLMGHKLQSRKSLGRLMGIAIDVENGVYVGAYDSSSPDGGAFGY
ncbi:MAG: gamma-glutamyltransferase [Crocinitomicaceae bacterium]|nr:gamma-glutamyltransferase [Crocinitomicaceae bacterium]